MSAHSASMNEKHSPGPWAQSGYDSSRVEDAGGYLVATTSVLHASLREGRANARLIAAAPTMLETLAWVRANYAGGSTAEINARIDAALAKASA